MFSASRFELYCICPYSDTECLYTQLCVHWGLSKGSQRISNTDPLLVFILLLAMKSCVPKRLFGLNYSHSDLQQHHQVRQMKALKIPTKITLASLVNSIESVIVATMNAMLSHGMTFIANAMLLLHGITSGYQYIVPLLFHTQIHTWDMHEHSR